MTAQTVVAICQFGGEFITKDDGTLSYSGGEARATNISRDSQFNDLKLEIANMFGIDSNNATIKYFLPFNKRTLITVSNDKDVERMIDFHVNSLSIDLFVSTRNDNRTIRSIAADSGTSTIENAGDDHNYLSKSNAAKNKMAIVSRVSVVDSGISNGAIIVPIVPPDNIKKQRVADDRVTVRFVAEDPDIPVMSNPMIDINRQEMLDSTALDKVDINSELMSIFNDPISFTALSMDNIHTDLMESHDSNNSWENIITDIGQEFDNVKSFRDELSKYAFARGFKYKFIKNEHTRVTAKCISENCPWRIHASQASRKQTFLIKKLNNVHTCQLTGENGQPKAKRNWLASIFREKVLDNPDVRPKDIARDLYNDYGITLSYCQVWHAKENARKEVYMLQEEATYQLPWLCEQIMATNPGSFTMITKSSDSRIRRCFISFYSLLSGFEHGCRPIIFLDRICLKVNNQWKILVAVSVDGNNEIFPYAFACVEDDTPDSWHWFLVQLKFAMDKYKKVTIVSSRQKGLDEFVPEVFDEGQHSYSLSHLIEELRAELKKGSWSEKEKAGIINTFKSAARAYSTEEFNAYMETIRNISDDIADWIESTNPEKWANAHFKGTRYEHLSSDIAEPLSKWISMKDESSAVHIMYMLLLKTAELVHTREEASRTLEGALTPVYEKKLQKEIPRARMLNVICSTETMFEVRSNVVHVVNIGSWECTCKRWQFTGLPCMHAIAVFSKLNKSVYDFCSKYFRRECYIMTYSEPIHALPDIDDMKYFLPAPSYPPPTNRPPERPKRKRINPNKTVIRPLHCSRCKAVGHNKATCEAQL